MLQSQHKMHSFLGKTIIGIVAVLVAGMGIAFTNSPPVESSPLRELASVGSVPQISVPAAPEPVETASPVNKFAVIIGINYPSNELGTVNFADQDAVLVHSVLTREMGFPAENVVLLQSGQATRENISQALNWLTTNPGVDANSEVVFYYSGHGLRNLGLLNIPGRGDDYALVPFDYGRYNYRMGEGLIWDDDLALLLSRIQPARMWISIDSCFSGGWIRPGIIGPNRIVTASSQANELSNEVNSAQKGVLTKYLVGDGLARGDLSIESAFIAAVDPAARLHNQTPQIYDGFPGGMTLQ